MKSNFSLKTLFVAGLILLCATFTKAGDVTLTIPESSVNNLFEALVHARLLNFGSTGDGDVSYFNVRTTGTSINIKPNNTFDFTFNVSTFSDFNFLGFTFDNYPLSGNLSGSGILIRIVEGEGFNIKFQLDQISFTGGNWFEELIVNVGILIFRDKIPDLTTSSKQPLLPNSINSIFTPDFPYISTSETAIMLSYDLKAGPRYITASNDVNGLSGFGFIENTTGGYEGIYASPHNFEWYQGSTNTIRTPDEILEPQPQTYSKYKNWFLTSNSDIIPTIAPREIEIVVGNSDQTYKAAFKPAVRIQATNSLEGTLNLGQVSYNGQAATTQNKYEFINNSATVQLASSPLSSGIDWNFYEWSDGTTNPTRNIGLNQNFNQTANYKAKNHSAVSSVVGLDNRRLVATDQFNNYTDPYVFRTYESTYQGISRIWIQYRTTSTQEWGNEFLIPIFTIPGDNENHFFTAARNPQIATSQGCVWVVYEALDNFDSQWKYVATLISLPYHDILRSYKHAIIYTDANKLDAVPAGTMLTISGDGSSSDGTKLAVGWKRPGSSAFEIGILSTVTMKKYDNDNKPYYEDEIEGTFRSGSIYPIFSNVQYGLDIAINGGKIGITSVYNNTLYFREATYTLPKSPDNISVTPGSWTWSSSPVSVTGSFSTLNYSPSIIAWERSFRVAWSALYFTSGSPNVVIWRNIGSKATNTSIKYVNMNIYGYGYNYFDGIQITRVNANENPTIASNFAFTAKHNFPTSSMTLMNTTVVTNETYPSQVSYASNIMSGITNRSISNYSTNNKVNGVYKTSNQGLFKLNEIATPNYVAKGSTNSNNTKFFSAAEMNYKKGKQEYEQFYVQALNQGKETLPLFVETDSTDTLWLSDWFTWEKAISLQAYSSDQGNLPFSLVLVNENGKTVAEVRAKGEKMSAINEINAEKLLDAFKTIVAFGDGTGEKVRIQIRPKSDKVEISLSQWLLPTEQVNINGDAVADISDWTQTEVPDEFGIQAYPNPFNPSTTLQVSLPNSSALSVQVFDIMGRLVSQLFKGEKQAGVHEFTFNASNLASGNYFIRLQYTNAKGAVQMQTKAITLIK